MDLGGKWKNQNQNQKRPDRTSKRYINIILDMIYYYIYVTNMRPRQFGIDCCRPVPTAEGGIINPPIFLYSHFQLIK